MDLYNLVVSAKLTKGGGGGDIDVDALNVTENGTYTASSGHAYSPVTVDVPNSYAASDEGKVVSNGALVGQASATKTANGTYDTTLNNEVVVNVPGPSGSISITQNGTVDVTQYASANVNVSGGGGDETLAALMDGNITSIVVPNGVTTLKNAIFSACSALSSVTLPSSLRSIANTVFYGTAIQDLVIPEGVTSIGDSAIRAMDSLKTLELPSTLTTIGKYFLSSCSNLETLTIHAMTPPSLDTTCALYNAASSLPHLQAIYVPAEKVNSYKSTAIWMNASTKIQAIPE